MRANNNKKGIALLLAVGILSIFTVTLTAFAINMQLEKTATTNYLNSAKARYLSGAGIDYSLAVVRNNFKSTVIDALSERWASPYTLNFPTYGSIQLSIQDEQARININNASLLLLSNISALGPTLAQNIINYRSTRVFSTREEVKLVSGIGSSTYNSIKDLITVNSYINPNRQNRSPVNINTVSQTVVTAVLTGISDGTNTITSPEAQSLSNEVMNNRPFNSWADFNSLIDNSASINTAKKNMLKTLLNPYSKWPAPSPTNFTTEFCLFSGCFSVTSNSTILNRAGNTAANGSIYAVISLFSNLNDAAFIYTTKEDFRGEDANYNDVLDSGEDLNGNGVLDVPVYSRVTWMDSCPVNSTDDLGLTYLQDFVNYPDWGYQAIKDSLKLGFWDNFDEDTDYTSSEWVSEQGGYVIQHSPYASKASQDKQLITSANYSKFVLWDISKWTFGGRFSLRLYNFDAPSVPSPGDGCEDVGQIEFAGVGGGLHKLFMNNFGYVYWPPWGRMDINSSGDITAPEDFMDVMFRCALWPNGGVASKYVTPSYDTFGQEKTYKIVSTGVNQQPSYFITFNTSGYTLVAQPWDNNRYNFPYFTPSSGSGWSLSAWRLSFYTNMALPVWDDVRLIPNSGTYTSSSLGLTGISSLEWGTISGTVTIPSTASPINETVVFETSTDGGISFVPVQTGGDITQSPSQSIQYRAVLATNDSDLSETPALEDVTLTFLKPNSAKTAYYKQISN